LFPPNELTWGTDHKGVLGFGPKLKMCACSVGVCAIQVGNIITFIWCFMICITSSYIIYEYIFMRAKGGERTTVWRPLVKGPQYICVLDKTIQNVDTMSNWRGSLEEII
jgi:hypothetical protein